MAGFGDRFAQWCRDEGREVPDAPLVQALNETGRDLAARFEAERNLLSEGIAGRVGMLAEFMRSRAGREAAASPAHWAAAASASPLPPPYSHVVFGPGVVEEMVRDSCAHGGNETGGLLCGFVHAGRGELRITHATESGPAARRSPTLFVRDAAYSQARLNEVVNETGGRSDYVGEWHRHASANTLASPLDEAMLGTIATAPQYGTPAPALVVLALPHASAPAQRRVAVYGWLAGRLCTVSFGVASGAP